MVDNSTLVIWLVGGLGGVAIILKFIIPLISDILERKHIYKMAELNNGVGKEVRKNHSSVYLDDIACLDEVVKSLSVLEDKFKELEKELNIHISNKHITNDTVRDIVRDVNKDTFDKIEKVKNNIVNLYDELEDTNDRVEKLELKIINDDRAKREQEERELAIKKFREELGNNLSGLNNTNTTVTNNTNNDNNDNNNSKSDEKDEDDYYKKVTPHNKKQ